MSTLVQMAQHGHDTPSRRGVLARSASALKWNYLGALVRAVCQLAIGVVLARLLGPGPFGIVALALVLIGACNLFAELGFASALIQSREIEVRDVRFVFTCQVALGTFLTLCGWLSADTIAGYFGYPDAAVPIRMLSCLLVLQALGQTSSALLRRELDFRNLQRISIGSYLLSYVGLGVPMAMAGMGVWALVAAYLGQALFAAIALIACARAPLGLALRPASAGVLTFGGKVVAANLSSWVLSNLDSLVVGRVFGVRDLGLYNRAMVLVASPMSSIASGFQGVLFSACSRIQDQRDSVKRTFLAASSVVGLVCLPTFVAISVTADTVIGGLYGAAWADAAAALRPLALVMPLTALLALVGPVLMAIDRVADEVKAQFLTVLVLLPLLYLAAKFSIALVAWAVVGATFVRWVLLVRAVLTALRASWGELFMAMSLPLAATAMVVTPTWIVDALATSGGLGAGRRLALVGSVAVTALLAGLRLLGPRLVDGDVGAFLRIRGPLPQPLAWLLNVKT